MSPIRSRSIVSHMFQVKASFLPFIITSHTASTPFSHLLIDGMRNLHVSVRISDISCGANCNLTVAQEEKLSSCVSYYLYHLMSAQ